MDKFIIEIQKYKMKELWDNKYDEVWDKIIIKDSSIKRKNVKY